MAQKPRRLKVLYTPEATRALNAIWNWTAANFGPEQADRYTKFIESKVSALASEYLLGNVISDQPDFRYAVLKRRRQGHGRIAVYRIREDSVQILTFYHTAQDWRSKFEQDELN
jgi:toxin ParE1/3/4